MIDFKLDPKSGVPFYRQIIDQIRYGVATGSLNVSEQLPTVTTVRALAVELKVNLNTVSKAYRELEIQNVLETQQGTGTFIGSISVQISDQERQSKLAGICAEFLSIAASYGFGIEEMINELKQRQGGEI
jgi:GntR family transcriptional regulator